MILISDRGHDNWNHFLLHHGLCKLCAMLGHLAQHLSSAQIDFSVKGHHPPIERSNAALPEWKSFNLTLSEAAFRGDWVE